MVGHRQAPAAARRAGPAARRGLVHPLRHPDLGERHAVDVASTTIEYRRAGRGPPVVFVHGFLSNANLWRKVVPRVRGRTCITPDWPLGSHTRAAADDADLSPPGVAALIAGFLDALDLDAVTLVGNDSGGAYSQIVAAERGVRVARLVLNSCETPDDTWPPRGFRHLQLAARAGPFFRFMYEPLRASRVWRSPTAYGLLARRPIDAETMRSYVRPILERADIRRDARKVIGSVSERYSREAATRLVDGAFAGDIELVWAADDRVFPLEHARAYAARLHADLHAIPGAYTYVAEDAPEALAAHLSV